MGFPLLKPGRRAQQPQTVVPIDRSNPLGAKVITHLPLRNGTLGTRGEKITLGTGGSWATSVKGRSLKGNGVAGAGSLCLEV